MVVCYEWELVGFGFVVFGFELLFCFVYLCNFWVGVDDLWNVVVVDVWFLIDDVFGYGYVFVFSFVCQYWVVYYVVDCLQVWQFGCVVFIYFDKVVLICCQVDCFQIQVVGVWYVVD